MKRDSAVLLGLVLASAALFACPATLGDRCANNICADLSTIDGGNGADGDADVPDAPTDPCVENPTDPKCIKEDEAFFVSGTGDDTAGLGTKDKPFKTLGITLGKLTEKKRRIYICDGTYDEDVVLTAAHSSVSLFGGVTCAWAVSPNKPLFGKTTLALKVDAAKGVAIADLAFEAKDATTGSGSSIAAFVTNGEVTFKRVSLKAGKGFKGDNGVLAPFVFPSAADLAGMNGDPPGNGGERLITCPDGLQTKGGRGGPNGLPGDDGTPGPPNKSTATCSGPGSVDTNGQAGGSPVTNGGAGVLGSLLPSGWVPEAGPDGPNGGPGQGGGGGYGLGGTTSTGGGGGAGGCGGKGGAGGKGGGASIAVVSLQSTVRLDTSILMSADAGAGGSGVAGQDGQNPGGGGGAKSTNVGSVSCNGGSGGPGGKGAIGGGGAGGISVGVLYKGSPPTLDPATTSATTNGKKGERGGPGTSAIDGVSVATLQL